MRTPFLLGCEPTVWLSLVAIVLEFAALFGWDASLEAQTNVNAVAAAGMVTRQRFATASTPESDGLLFQYGTYAFSGRPMFTVDLTRQFDISDDVGEHDHYVQIHCELRYECEPALDALGSSNSWFFHDANADLDEWLAAMEGHLELLLARGPSEIDVYKEPV
ncbi:hypothetical protein ACFVIY_39475 [Streptomyces sp. NPDC127166]|uniref:hypothetical protein n=1 Tax=Streptomyces sp. NPDC127166 TaxID=3345380 RepID=UPI003638BA1B